MIITGTVFDPSNASTPDGSSQPVNQGRANELIVAELHGKYFEHCYRGNVFYGSTSTSGVVIPIATTKTSVYTIWNPSGSGRLCVPIVSFFGWNATTAALGALVWTATTAAGDRATATAPFTAFTAPATPISANLGAGKTSKMNFGNDATTITITAVSTFYRMPGVTILPTTAATTVAPFFVLRDDWDGTGVIPPGNAVHLMASTAVLATLVVSTVWAEIPL